MAIQPMKMTMAKYSQPSAYYSVLLAGCAMCLKLAGRLINHYLCMAGLCGNLALYSYYLQ